MGITVRQYLRSLDKAVLRELFDTTDLTDDERKLLTYAFIRKERVDYTCDALFISKSKYHNWLNRLLVKLEYKIKELDKLHTLK